MKKKYIVIINFNYLFLIVENVLNRNFSSFILGEKWVLDIIYIRVNDNWNYFIIIMDLVDRKIVGWILSEDMIVENMIWKTWIKVRFVRNIIDNFIFYFDRGV